MTIDAENLDRPDDNSEARSVKERPAGSRGKPISIFSISLMARAADMIAILATSFVLGVFLNERIDVDVIPNYQNLTLLAALFAPIIIHWCGGYDTDACFGLRKSWASAMFGFAALVALALAIGFSFKVTAVFSRVWITNWIVFSAVAILVFRFFIWIFAVRLRKRGAFDSRAIIVGAGAQGQRLYEFVRANPSLALNIVGFVDDRTDRVPASVDGLPVLGDVGMLKTLIRSGNVDQVLVSLPWAAEFRLKEVIESIAETPIRVRLAPDLAAFEYINRPFTSLAGLPVLNLFDRPISGMNNFLKMLEDYVLAIVLLILISPVLCLIAIAIKIDSKGPVFFRQAREGFNNRTFHVLKFRSMKIDDCEIQDITQVTVGNPRVTRVGKVLRRTSLDELPQLFNVLTGDMSLVGPRPHAPSTRAGGLKFEEAVSRYAARHRVKPGITGWAQVNGWRGETDTVEKLEKRLQHDLYYIDHWSLALDLQILVRTVLVVARQNEAY